MRDRCGAALLDIHADPFHHRAVFTLAGPHVIDAARQLTAAAVELVSLVAHDGVHPRMGAVDVVPFVPLAGSTIDDAVRARNAFATWASTELQLPCFLYGPKHSLPDIRRRAFTSTGPDCGPTTPHPTAGAVAVGAREPLIAYNIWLDGVELITAKAVADQLRSPARRTLGLQVGPRTQVSCSPSALFDAVANLVPVAGAELVGLMPKATLDSIDPARWNELDLAADKTIEARLTKAGLGGS